MNDRFESEKICPSCNKINNPDNNYCRRCGANLEEIELKNVEINQRSDSPEENKIEITESQKGKKYGYICCILVLLGIFLMIMLILFNFLQTEPLVARIGILFISIALIPFTIGSLIYILCWSMSMHAPKTFSISDQEIEINLPKKKVNIRWSRVLEIEGRTRFLGFLVKRYGYTFDFILRDGSEQSVTLERDRHFKKKTIKKIKNLIEQYCDKLGKLTYLK